MDIKGRSETGIDVNATLALMSYCDHCPLEGCQSPEGDGAYGGVR